MTDNASSFSSDAPLFANAPGALRRDEGDFLPAALESEIRAIYGRSPLYGRRFALPGGRLRWESYLGIPALSKREIVERGHEAFFADYREIERGLREKK